VLRMEDWIRALSLQDRHGHEASMQILVRLACFYPAIFGCRFLPRTTIFIHPVTRSLAYPRFTICEANNNLALKDVWSKQTLLSQAS
jgi:hypothetical protein